MEKIEVKERRDKADGGQTEQVGMGIPLDTIPEHADNQIEIKDQQAASTKVVERATDPEQDIINAPRTSSFEFATKFSKEFYQRR